MIKKLVVGLAIWIFICGMVNDSQANKIVLANDEWTLSDTGFSDLNDPGIFINNVASWFSEGTTGNFLAHSANFGLTGKSLKDAITNAGHTWTVNTNIFDLETLLNYDGIFLAGNAADTTILTDYVNAGGNVYLAGGTALGGISPEEEAARWNPFLNNFDLGFGTTYNGIGGSIAINSTHTIFSNVDLLYQRNGNDTLELITNGQYTEVVVESDSGHGLYAVYDKSPAPVPEPTTILLFGVGLAGLVGTRLRKKKK